MKLLFLMTSEMGTSVSVSSHTQRRNITPVMFGKFLICFATAVLTFFIAGLLYLLCFEHVDNLGAYRIPSETGLLPRKPVREAVG
jgi:hypothetical protein